MLPLISRPCAIVAGGGDSHALHALGLLAMSAIVSDPDSKESIAPVRTTSVRMYAIPTHCPNRGEYAANTISPARTSPLRNLVPGIADGVIIQAAVLAQSTPLTLRERIQFALVAAGVAILVAQRWRCIIRCQLGTAWLHCCLSHRIQNTIDVSVCARRGRPENQCCVHDVCTR